MPDQAPDAGTTSSSGGSSSSGGCAVSASTIGDTGGRSRGGFVLFGLALAALVTRRSAARRRAR
jgi:hypothetical protein